MDHPIIVMAFEKNASSLPEVSIYLEISGPWWCEELRMNLLWYHYIFCEVQQVEVGITYTGISGF